ncbi:MAG TPA: GNAT family protein [Dictyobacter sp.]|jgi:RimJ/RimL family protein N-acetyltransferase|nr:GNAT family protein [Dictyobacter sp.]
MQFFITPMTRKDALAITSWRYAEPYKIYNIYESEESLAELLDPRSPHFGVRDEQGNLLGFYGFGTSALVWESERPDIYIEDHIVAIGLGMKPDLTGQGLGSTFVQAGLDFARQQFEPTGFRLYVYPWNERAIKAYEKAGFQQVGIVKGYANKEFLAMSRSV